MQVGLTELIVIVLLVIAIVKPNKLEECAGALGRAMRGISDATEPLQEVNKEVQEVVSEVKGEDK